MNSTILKLKKAWEALPPRTQELARKAYEAMDEVNNTIVSFDEIADYSECPVDETSLLEEVMKFLVDFHFVNRREDFYVMRPEFFDEETLYQEDFHHRLDNALGVGDDEKQQLASRISFHLELAREYLSNDAFHDHASVAKMLDTIENLKVCVETGLEFDDDEEEEEDNEEVYGEDDDNEDDEGDEEEEEEDEEGVNERKRHHTKLEEEEQELDPDEERRKLLAEEEEDDEEEQDKVESPLKKQAVAESDVFVADAPMVYVSTAPVK